MLSGTKYLCANLLEGKVFGRRWRAPWGMLLTVLEAFEFHISYWPIKSGDLK